MARALADRAMSDDTPDPLFRLTGVGMEAQFSNQDRSSIGILTLSTDAGDLHFAVSIDVAEAIINAMNTFLETAANNAGRH
jgi:hypothetical protein